MLDSGLGILRKLIGVLSKAGGVMTVVLKSPTAEGLMPAERRAEKIGGFPPKSYTIHSLGWKGRHPSQEVFRKNQLDGGGKYLSTTFKLSFFTIH